MEPAERAVVRVFRRGTPFGMGFLVGDDLVLTCAHVVGDRVDFPFLDGTSPVSEVFRSDEDDVAVLRLAEVPAGARALRVVAHDGLRDHRVRAFGVTANRPDGVWSHGVVRGPIAGGRIHVEDDRSHGVPLSRGFSGGPLLDDSLGAVVGMVVAVEERADRRIGYALSGAALHRSWPDLAALAVPGSPFRGLEPFGPEDAEHFFGRAAQARQLRESLDGTGVLVVAGPSGCGKSSLVMAGLLPLLEGGSVIVRPATASTPWAALAAALDEEVAPDRVEDAVNRLLVHRDLRRLTIVVDQFDEALARHPDAPDFLHALLGLVRHRAPRVDLVVTTTTEPLLRLTTDPRFAALPDRTTTVGTPDLREVVEGPLRPVGMPVLQEGLTDALLADLSAESNPLPLLEFTLTLLWDEQDKGVLTHQAYRDLGGVAGAVSTYAEQVWRRFDAAEIRHALTQLVSPSPGHGHVRRAVPIEDLGEIAGDLARTRLVTLGPSTVELAHHALVDHWQRLRDWVEDSRDFRTWQDDLDRTAHRWTHSPDRALLPRGKPLRKARTMARTHPLTRTQLRFLAAATKARTVRASVAALAAAVVALLVFSLVTAVRISDEEEARFAADAAAVALLDTAADASEDVKILKTLLAYRAADRIDTRDALRDLAYRHRFTSLLLPTSAQPNPSGTRLLDSEGGAVWDLTTDPPRRADAPVRDRVLRWAGDDRLMGASATDIRLFDLVTGEVTVIAEQPANVVFADGTGQWIAYRAGDDPGVHLRAPDGRTTTLPLVWPPGSNRAPFTPVGVLPTGEVVVMRGPLVSAMPEAGLRELPEGRLVDQPGQAEPVLTRCTELGPHAVGAVSGSTVVRHDSFAWCASAVFSADGGTVALIEVSGDRTALKVGRTGDTESQDVDVPDGARLKTVVAEPSGHLRVVLETDWTVHVLRVPPSDDLDRALRSTPFPQFTPNGAHVITDRGFRTDVWDVGRRAKVTEVDSSTGVVDRWAFSPDSGLVARNTRSGLELATMPEVTPVGVLEPLPFVGELRFLGGDRLLTRDDRHVAVADVRTREWLGPPFTLDARGDETIAGTATVGPHDVAVVTSAGRVLRFHVGTGTVAPGSEFDVGFRPLTYVRSTAVDAGGRLIAVQKRDGIELWDLREHRHVADLDLPDRSVAVGLRFREDADELELDLRGTTIDSGSDRMAVLLWERDASWWLPVLLGAATERVSVLPQPGQAAFADSDHGGLESGDPAVWAARLCGVVAHSMIPPLDETAPAGGRKQVC
ncbi:MULTISPECIES: nSTAND1 domain-containing NTPase [unclassified Saccharothrix]|uniref:nSTAND1 domain-containing NTPase n=1 Tax=unclassified Saccharothrix TaxID=2593673 RepID=UPI00307D9D7C